MVMVFPVRQANPNPVFRAEWAYAGIFFDLTGAAASCAAVGGYGAYGFHVIIPLILAGITVASWALRPASRTLVALAPAKEAVAA